MTHGGHLLLGVRCVSQLATERRTGEGPAADRRGCRALDGWFRRGSGQSVASRCC